MTTQALIEDCKTIFAVGLCEKFTGIKGHLFAAPRPLLGKAHDLGVFLHGRFFSEVEEDEYCAESFIKMNIDLDARIVLRAKTAELLEVYYQNCEYADRYREYSFDDQVKMLSSQLADLNNMPYHEATRRLELARVKLAMSNQTRAS